MEELLELLQEKAQPENLAGMARYGMKGEKRLGVSIPDLRKIARKVGKDHRLALDLYQTGIPEAMILASMVADPEQVTRELMDDWVKGFLSWDVCDQVCMNLFEKSPFAWQVIPHWTERPEEFVKRAAYALIACLAWHDKDTPDEQFTDLFPVIRSGATDERNMVKKAVSWALRNIGKRNLSLNKTVIQEAKVIRSLNTKTSRWIASDVLRDLTREKIRVRLKKKTV
jgi:3-methyladenine DNA glycosylase AlkD